MADGRTCAPKSSNWYVAIWQLSCCRAWTKIRETSAIEHHIWKEQRCTRFSYFFFFLLQLNATSHDTAAHECELQNGPMHENGIEWIDAIYGECDSASNVMKKSWINGKSARKMSCMQSGERWRQYGSHIRIERLYACLHRVECAIKMAWRDC